MITETETKERTLNLNDRCDAKECGAAALVNVKGISGELMFCGHHYNKIVNDFTGNEKLMAFAFEIIDERWAIQENRTKGEN